MSTSMREELSRREGRETVLWGRWQGWRVVKCCLGWGREKVLDLAGWLSPPFWRAALKERFYRELYLERSQRVWPSPASQLEELPGEQTQDAGPAEPWL